MRKLVIHPFLLAIFPVVYLYSRNADEIATSELLFPLLTALGGALLVFFILKLITKSYARSGIVTFFVIALFYFYGTVRDSIITGASASGRQYSVCFYLGLTWAALTIAVLVLVAKWRRHFLATTRFLNITSVILVLISLASTGVFFLKEGGKPTPQSPAVSASPASNLPDIYYIILDEYAREDTLKEIYNYANSEFVTFLTDRGFYVAGGSRSNYDRTYLSLPSSLNMRYLAGEELGNRSLQLGMIGNSEVARFLEAKGYDLVNVASSWDFKGIDKYMQVEPPGKRVFGMRVSNFAYYLVQSTALAPFASLFSDHGRTAILDAFDVLAEMPERKQPTFVFAHILSPHSPFIFDRNGNAVPMSILELEGDVAQNYRRGYLEQLLYVSKKTEELVDAILAKSEVKPIIILQADHGPQSVGEGATPELTEKINLNERMNILNAYYLPGKNKPVLYDSITPVNTFRTVLNSYFGTNYERLKDESRYYTSYPDRYITVTPQD